MFTFTGRISIERNPLAGVAGDEGITLAIVKETDAADESVAANRKTDRKSEYSHTCQIFLFYCLFF